MDAAFATLGIAEGAQPIEIIKAFRARSREAHPDTGGDPKRFAEIVAAYRTLQRAGLAGGTVTSSGGEGCATRSLDVARGEHPAAPSEVPARARPADRFYRRFLEGLGRAGEMPGPSGRIVRPTHDDAPPAQVSFAEVLERELRRAGGRLLSVGGEARSAAER